MNSTNVDMDNLPVIWRKQHSKELFSKLKIGDRYVWKHIDEGWSAPCIVETEHGRSLDGAIAYRRILSDDLDLGRVERRRKEPSLPWDICNLPVDGIEVTVLCLNTTDGSLSIDNIHHNYGRWMVDGHLVVIAWTWLFMYEQYITQANYGKAI